MSDKSDFKAFCSVSEMADKLRLSRARFYQLQNIGIFPQPIRDDHAKRPFYPLDLQQKCMEIRKTGIGLNGRAVLFNTPRENKNTSNHKNDQEGEFNGFCDELASVLREFKFKLTRDKIKEALTKIYPHGLSQYNIGRELIRDLAEYFGKGL